MLNLITIVALGHLHLLQWFFQRKGKSGNRRNDVHSKWIGLDTVFLDLALSVLKRLIRLPEKIL